MEFCSARCEKIMLLIFQYLSPKHLYQTNCHQLGFCIFKCSVCLPEDYVMLRRKMTGVL
jgi:hypothetical protein